MCLWPFADSATTAEDTPLTAIDVLGNDTDVDNPGHSCRSSRQRSIPIRALVCIVDGNSVHPGSQFALATAPITYVSTGHRPDQPGAATVTVTYRSRCTGHRHACLQDSAEDVGSDADGDALTYALGTGPAHGTLSLNANGTGLTRQQAISTEQTASPSPSPTAMAV